MESAKTYVFDNGKDSGNGANWMPLITSMMQQRGLDPNLLLALNGGNGLGGNGNFVELFFLVILLGIIGNGNGNLFGGNGANREAAINLLNSDSGRQMLSNAIQGNANAISELASTLGCSVTAIQQSIGAVQSSVSSVGNKVGLTGQQVINAVQQGNLSIAQQLCKCCCDNQLAIANQTSAIQQGIFGAQTALNEAITRNGFASQMQSSGIQHSIDMSGANSALSVCQQTNTLQNSQNAGTQRIVDAINGLQVNITKEFCDVREREMQSKIDTQADIITQLRGQLDNDRQTAQLQAAIAPIQQQVSSILNRMPNTIPVQYPNVVAVNNTPNCGGGCGCNNNFFG